MNLYSCIDDYCADNNISCSSVDAFQKMFKFKKKSDAVKVLKFLFKEHRAFYYHVNACYKNGKIKKRSIESKIFCEYDDYLFNVPHSVKYYYIYFMNITDDKKEVM